MHNDPHSDDQSFDAQSKQDMNIYDFLMLGLGEIAYVKREINKDGERFLVCESDGTEIGLVDEYQSATYIAEDKRLRLLYVN